MIELTRLNGQPLFVNCDLIKWAEAAPDTMLTLVSGEKVVVRESCADVVQRVLEQRARLLALVGHFSSATGAGPELTATSSADGIAGMWSRAATNITHRSHPGGFPDEPPDPPTGRQQTG